MSTKDDNVTAAAGRVLWRDRFYPTEHVTWLPRVYRLSDHLTACSIDYASVDQLALCRQMMEYASHTGDNVGTDEYPDDDSYAWFFAIAELFAVTDVTTGHVISFVAIRPCLYARGIDTCLASIYIFRSRDVATDWPAFRSLIRLAVHVTSSLGLGYTECVYSATLSCRHLVAALRAEQFSIKATLPYAIDIEGLGLRENVIMTRELEVSPRPPRHLAEILSAWNKFFVANMKFLNWTESPGPLPSLDFLPRDYVFTNGLRCIIRTAVANDVTTLYAMMMSASSSGQGYSLYEFPSEDYFRLTMLTHDPCIVYEERATGEIIGFSIIAHSFFARTTIGGVGESDTMVSEKYRGQRVGSEIVFIELAIMKQTGLTLGINDTMINNSPMMNLLRRRSNIISTFVGVIPKAAFHPAESGGKVTGEVNDGEIAGEWEDVILTYYDFEATSPTFTELADANAALSNSASKL